MQEHEQQQEVEVSFCELCGASVPASDLVGGAAVQHRGKTVGKCCLAELRPAGDGSSASAPRPTGASKGAADAGRLTTVAVVLLAAVAAGTIFLDSRLSSVEDDLIAARQVAAEQQKLDGDVLQRLDVRSEALADRADIEALQAQVTSLQASQAESAKAATQRQAVLEQEILSLGRQMTEAASKSIDYRPLFDDLRQRHVRVMAAIEGMRSQVAAVPAAVEPVAADEPAAATGPDVPDDLQEPVAKLTAADPAVRFEAVDVLIDSKDLRVLPFLLPLAKDPDAFVRRLTVEGLREFTHVDSVDALLAALLDDDENVCDTAWRSLCDLTGQKFKFDAAASKEARGRAARSWQDWWEKARDKFGK